MIGDGYGSQGFSTRTFVRDAASGREVAQLEHFTTYRDGHVIHAADTRAPARALALLLGATYPHWGAHVLASGGHMAPVVRWDVVNPLIAGILENALR